MAWLGTHCPDKLDFFVCDGAAAVLYEYKAFFSLGTYVGKSQVIRYKKEFLLSWELHVWELVGIENELHF